MWACRKLPCVWIWSLTDLILEHDVLHVWIRFNQFRRLKNRSSERRIPLVGPAFEAAKSRAPTGAVFSKVCHDTSLLSQRLNKIIQEARVPKSTHLVAYSFRHTLEEALRSAEVPIHNQKRILGHDDGSTTGRYGAPAGPPTDLKTALERAIPKFGTVDQSIYSEQEL